MSGGLFAHKTLSQFMLLGGLVLHYLCAEMVTGYNHSCDISCLYLHDCGDFIPW